ncbi:hypothetical protein [Fredinandcohnia sp. 179-A 10B2 NHS]|uniref:hypothetical protein n=1 Tax=Fredinandcohnia sp. 179-A 10B2 NHS TaxID=3235176 RepID=UPI0039A17B04
MGKKKRGHYCFKCGRDRANEKFSGKGHRQHICKDCKRKGNQKEEVPTIKPSFNFRRILKIRSVVMTDTREYMFFTIHNNIYCLIDFDESFEAMSYIYKYHQDLQPSFKLTSELNNNFEDIYDALLLKFENRYDLLVYLDEYGLCRDEDMIEYEPTPKQIKYLRLVPEIEAAYEQWWDIGDVDILNIMIVDVD